MEDKKNVMKLDEEKLEQVVGGRDEKDVKKEEREIPTANEKEKERDNPGGNTPY